jgi:glycosyltransferase involved in cell wall biosynthesis
LRILHVIPSLAARDGGSTRVTIEFCRELLRRGHHAEIYTTNADGKRSLDVNLGTPVSVQGVRVTYFPTLGGNYFKISPRFACAVKSAVRSFDLVHISSLYQFPSTTAAHSCRKHGVPYVITPHGSLDPYLYKRHPLRKRLYESVFERQNLAAAATVHFTSAEEMRLANLSGIRFRRSVAPLGVEFEPVPSDWQTIVSTRWPELAGKRVVLFLGRVNFKKGLDILARAFGQIYWKHKDVCLVIAGPDNEGFGREVREFLSAECCLSAVTFTGMLEGAPKLALLKRAQVFAVPSYAENFCIALVEAMGAGLPVVLSDRVNIWREIRDAGAGLVVNTTSDKLAEAISNLLANPPLAREFGRRGYQLARDRFSWETAGPQLLELYRAAISPVHTI